MEYVSASFLLGMVTMDGSGQESRRVFSLGLTAFLCIAEVYYVLTWHLADSTDGVAISVSVDLFLE